MAGLNQGIEIKIILGFRPLLYDCDFCSRKIKKISDLKLVLFRGLRLPDPTKTGNPKKRNLHGTTSVDQCRQRVCGLLKNSRRPLKKREGLQKIVRDI